MIEHVRDGGCLEQIGTISQHTGESLLCFSHRKRQVKLRLGALDGNWCDAYPCQIAYAFLPHAPSSILQDKHHIKEWGAAHISFRCEFFHHFLKGDILVHIGL